MIKRSISLLFISILLIQSAAVASALGKYKPPQEGSAPSGNTRATGSRGQCRNDAETPLTLLAPYTHVGQTESQHPLLAWYVDRERSLPMQLSIYERDANKRPQLFYNIELETTPGIMKVKLPKDRPGLETGKRYIWEVAIMCDRNRPATHIVASAEIDVVNSKTQSDRNSLWYDILKSSLSDAKKGKLTPESAILLKQLAELEKQQGKKGIRQGDRLMNIVSSSERSEMITNRR
ncbi:MAG: DUF928 domain-containing protein [Prochloraceae cyanobacterium]